MSPYGAAAAKPPSPTLTSTTYSNDVGGCISVHHITKSSCPDELLRLFYEEFEKELDIGRTYPQEGPIGFDGFRNYFFAGDVFVGIISHEGPSLKENPANIEAARAGRDWGDCVAGSYYVKDNYPGRSSHICNGGFVVLSKWRGKRYGSLLGESYLHYAPLLGYRGSVFNLVYVNNVASVAIWERLGFKRVGQIPGAGRLKKADGSGEEYVDAAVYYKSFVE